MLTDAAVEEGLNTEQRMLQDTALTFAKEELAPNMAKWDQEEDWNPQTFRKLASMGFAGIYSSEEYGGTGLTRLDASIIFEALATGCVSTTAYLSIHKCVTKKKAFTGCFCCFVLKCPAWQHVCLDDRHVWHAGAAPKVPSGPALHECTASHARPALR